MLVVEPKPEDAAADEDESNTRCSTSTSGSNLILKKGTKLEVWHHFGLQQKDGAVIEVDKPVCRLCSLKVLVKYGNTTNLFIHLKTSIPKCMYKLRKEGYKSIPDMSVL